MTKRILGIVALSFLIIFSGCARRVDDGAVIATVDERPIYLKDLKRELSNRVRQDPSLTIDKNTLNGLVDTLVKRQIIIQAAMDKKLAEDQRFADTIKTFWEQTLIRDFVKYQAEAAERYIFVTDKEIEEYYDDLLETTDNVPPLKEMRGRLKKLIERRKKSEALESWLEAKMKSAKIHINRSMISKETVK